MTEELPERKGGGSLAAGIAGAVLGGISGAVIGASYSGGRGAILGALVVGLYQGAAEAITDARRQPGQLKPLWHRMIGSIISGAAAGVIFIAIFPNLNLIIAGLLFGALIGLTNLGPRRAALGAMTGLGVGILVTGFGPEPLGAILGGGIVFAYRSLHELFFRGVPPLQLTGEHVSQEDAKFVVPFEAHTGYIGADFMESLARESDGTFKRNKADIGIVESLDSLHGPNFDPDRVDPLIREFYEHTTRFRLSIVPKWNPLIKPFFWFFKTFIAQRIGQANLPFNTEEAQRGMVSYLDVIDYKAAEGDVIETLRGWIRAYEDSGEAIYVGVYTVVRNEGVGYVSVGFPLPEANFTATLMPFNGRNGDLVLSTIHAESAFTGHYLSDIDNEVGSLTILKLPTMDEEILVYLENGQLKTRHRFFLGGYKFLTLHYNIERLG